MSLPINFSSRAYELLSEDARREVMKEFGRAIQAKVSGKIEWARELVRLTGLLGSNAATTSDFASFWIRLHGVLELAIDDGPLVDTLEPRNEIQARMREIVRDLREKGAVLIRCFDDEELLFIEFQRHGASHPFLDTYFLRFRGDSQSLRTDRYCVLLGRRVPLAAIRMALSTLRERGSDEGVAAAFACRIEGAVREYYGAMIVKHELLGERG